MEIETPQRPKKDKRCKVIAEKILNIGVYLLTIAIEFTIMYRFYFMYGDYTSFDCVLQIVILSLANSVIFDCLYKASNIDCGRAPIYSKAMDDDGGSAKDVCHWCQAYRINPFVHHCSTCGVCIEMMDHHCFFLGQCVGKGNMKYFM
jgi:hypothetical protein